MNKMINDALILFAITLVSGLGLGAVYNVTSQARAQQEQKTKNAAYQAVFDGADHFDEYKINDSDQKKIADYIKKMDTDEVKANGASDINADINEIMEAKDKDNNVLGYSGAKDGLAFYLIPDLSKISGTMIVKAMNQAFFTLSVGMGGMAIFGSYIGKERSLLGESVNIIVLDTFVAVVAGMIMFPACDTYNLEVTAGPSLLFDTMASVFNHMQGGRWWLCLPFSADYFSFTIFMNSSPVMVSFS